MRTRKSPSLSVTVEDGFVAVDFGRAAREGSQSRQYEKADNQGEFFFHGMEGNVGFRVQRYEEKLKIKN